MQHSMTPPRFCYDRATPARGRRITARATRANPQTRGADRSSHRHVQDGPAPTLVPAPGCGRDRRHALSRERDLVLKTGNRRSLYQDWRTYRRLPATLRNRYFAKLYWRTKYCLLQKYGKAGRVPPKRLATLKTVAQEHGLIDVRPDNIRLVEGVFKIVDASPSTRR